MKIIFFLEPAIEFGNPTFRFSTLRNIIIPQIKALTKANHECCLFASEPVLERARQDGIDIRDALTVAIDPLSWTNQEGYLSRSLRHLRNEITETETRILSKIIAGSNPPGFYPDLVIVWESPIEVLKTVFPNVPIMVQQPGLLSRSPYQNLISMDEGLLWNATQPRSSELTNNHAKDIENLRRTTKALFSLDFLSVEFLEKLRSRFNSLILLPLQVDDYFMVNGCLESGTTQVELITSILMELPEHIGLIVTSYRTKDNRTRTLTDAMISYLRSRFKNFIYDKAIDDRSNPSQILTTLVDGVVCVSSSIGFHAALWKKPLMTIGRSHLEPYKTAQDLSELIQQAEKRLQFCRDNEVLWSLSMLNFPVRDFHSSQYIDRVIEFAKFGRPVENDSKIMESIFDTKSQEHIFLSQVGLMQQQQSKVTGTHTAELAMQIPRYEVISFDVFDTLVNRPFMQPSDLFDLMDRQLKDVVNRPDIDFRFERKTAESIAFEVAVSSGRGEIEISEIYEVLRKRTGISERHAQQLMEMEKSAEVRLMQRREAGYHAFELAKALNKRIILVSDMYLPKDVIEMILLKCGYFGFEKLYLSSEVGLKKHSGALYDYVLTELDISPGKVLHIGDNLKGDIQRSKEKGMKAFHLVQSIERFKLSTAYTIPWKRDENRHSLDWSIILACVGHKFCNNPYLPERKGTLFNADPRRLGYYGVGPLLLGFAHWLLKAAMRDGVQRLYFLSRDGLLMKRAYDLVAAHFPEAPKSIYLLCSRRAVNLAKAENLEHLMDLLNVEYAHQMHIVDLLKNRFGLNVDENVSRTLAEHGFDINSRIVSDDRRKLKSVIMALANQILDIAKTERRNYLQYLKSQGIFSEGKVAVVDIGYAGTMQESLFILNGSEKPIEGYYLITFRTALSRVQSRGLVAQAFLSNFVDRHDTFHPFCKHVPMYETLFSAPETSFVRIFEGKDGTLVPVFAAATLGEEKRKEVVTKIQSGAVEFVEEFLARFGTWISVLDIEPTKTIRVLDEYFSKPHPKDAQILMNVEFEDLYGGRSKTVLLPVGAKNEEDCIWRQGRESLKVASRGSNAGKAIGTFSDKRTASRTGPEGVIHIVFAPVINLASVLFYFLAKRVLRPEKYKKLRRDPNLFFFDAKSPLARFFDG